MLAIKLNSTMQARMEGGIRKGTFRAARTTEVVLFQQQECWYIHKCTLPLHLTELTQQQHCEEQ